MGGVVIINNLYNLKKIISLILISCIFTQLIVTDVEATTYEKENIISINSIGISNNEIEYPSGSTEVFVDINSEIVIDELYLCYENPYLGRYQEVYMEYNKENNRFEGRIYPEYKVEEEESYNEYLLQSINIWSNGDFYVLKRDSCEFQGVDFTQLDYSIVKWIPKINSIILEKNELIQYRDSSTIQVDIEEVDKIKEVYIYYDSNDWNGYSYDKKLEYNTDTNLFEGNIDVNYISNYIFKGIKIITSYNTEVIIYRDELENKYSINTEYLDYKVKRWSIDIKDFNIDKNEVLYNIDDNIIKISMNIKEYTEISSVRVMYSNHNNITNYSNNFNGITDENIQSYLGGNDTNISYPGGLEFIDLYYNEETGLFEGSYKLCVNPNKNIANYIYGIEVCTKYGEYISIKRNDLINYEINANNLDINVKSFMPKSIEIDNKTVTYGQEANLKLDLSNYPKKIEEVEIKYNEYYGDESLRILYKLSGKEDNIYLVKFKVGSFTAEGIRELSSINIKNTDGTICEIIANPGPSGFKVDLSEGNFTVKSSFKYMIYPMNVYTSKNAGQADENIKITVENVKMNVDTMKIIYVNTQSQKEIVSLMNYDSKINKWTGDFNIDKDLDEGIWIIDRIILGEYIDGRYESQDINNIYLYPVEKYIKDFSKADIEVISSDIDLLAPEAPKIYTVVNNKTTTIEGIAEPNATIIIEKELKIFSGVKIEEVARTVSDKNGLFKVNIPMQNINTNLGIKAVDACGNTSEYTNIIVKNINKEDVNYDEVVDILDLALVARKYNTLDGESLWDTNLDINEDGIVDIFDIAMISKKMK